MVGRELDLAVALEQLKRVERGSSTALLVRGDAGIGKSRLIAELAGRARQLGHQVLAGRADDLDRGIPFAVFRDAFARLAFDEEPTPEVLELVEEFRRTVEASIDAPGSTATASVGPGGSASPPDASSDDYLSIVFAVVVRVLRSLAKRGPLVLILEDLHVADPASLALVGPMARLADLPMLTAVTLRPSAAAADAERLLERMADDGRGAVLDLEPLDRHDTHALVAAVLRATPDEEVGDAVFAASGGNPFFASEAAQSYADASAVVISGGRARLVSDAPALGLRPNTALLRRLFAGTSADVELAKVMAVFGRFSLRHLPLAQRMTGQSADDVARSFDRLVKAGIMVEAGGGGYDFSHAIVRSTLYDDIGPAERRRLHGVIADELARDRRAGIVLDVLELATHVAASAQPGDEAAADVLLEAGRAVAWTAPLVSAEYHRRAVELLPGESPKRHLALAMQARALHVSSRPTEASTVGRVVLGELPDGSVRRSTATLVVSDLYLGGNVDAALDVLEQERRAGTDRCPLAALEVNILFQAGRLLDAAAHFPAALEALEGPPTLQVVAYGNLMQYANHVGRVDVAIDLLDRLDALANTASPSVERGMHELAAYADWRPGLVERLEAHLETARGLRPDGAVLSIGGSFEAAEMRLHWMRGRWDEALAVARGPGFDLEQRGALTPSQLLHCLAVEVLIDRGAVDEASALADHLVTPILSLERNVGLVRGRLARAVGDLDGAERLLDVERARPSPLWKRAEVLRELVEIYLETDRRIEAELATVELEALAATTGWLETIVAAAGSRAAVDRDVDRAREYLRLVEDERWEHQQAHAALLLGELDDDPATNLALANTLYDSFGAAPARRRTAAAMRARNLSVPRRAAQQGTALSDTEAQLVRLEYEGLSNRQIATAMHYSPKTIEVYLSRVYVKTGCPSRLALIRAVEHGDVEAGLTD
jgi:DNA-binding CsgD family transcriptional regulator